MLLEGLGPSLREKTVFKNYVLIKLLLGFLFKRKMTYGFQLSLLSYSNMMKAQAGNQMQTSVINTKSSFFLFSWYFKSSRTNLAPVFQNLETRSQLHMTGLPEPTSLKAIWKLQRLVVNTSAPIWRKRVEQMAHICTEVFFSFSLNTLFSLVSELLCLWKLGLVRNPQPDTKIQVDDSQDFLLSQSLFWLHCDISTSPPTLESPIALQPGFGNGSKLKTSLLYFKEKVFKLLNLTNGFSGNLTLLTLHIVKMYCLQ